MTTIQITLLVALALSIIIGFITRTNAGIIALVFAWLIGCFMMQMRPSQVVALWPTRIFFILFAVTYFYNYATGNGTLEKLAAMIMYKFRKFPKSIPFVIFFVAFLISFMGAGFYAVVALLAPLSYAICEKSKMNPVLGAMAVMNGAVSGGTFFTTSTGSVVREIITLSGYQEQAISYTMNVFIASTLGCFVSVLGAYFILKGHKVTASDLHLEEPEPFTTVQKKTMGLVVAMMALVMVPVILNIFFSDVLLIKALASLMDVGFVSLMLGVLATLMKLGDQRKALKNVPWNTIVLISGIGVLIALATNAGLIETLGTFVAGAGHPLFVAILISTVAAIMSIFSSTVGVVLPTLYPLVGTLAAATGLSPAYLFVIINGGSVSSGASPFSSGGGLMLGSCSNEETSRYMYPRLIAASAVFVALNVLWTIIYYFIF